MERAGAYDIRACGAHTIGEAGIRRHDGERSLRLLGQAGDVIVGGIAARAGGEEDVYGPAAVVEFHRAAIEDHGDTPAVAAGEGLELGHQPPDRTVPVAPPSVGARADDVHPVDEPAQSGGPRNRTSSYGFGGRRVTTTPVPRAR